ncbi:hypothetical protein Q9K09_26430, partial [Klebsiella pneumoniae subsp. pneumoniae]|nr:hypothetical protein [Klebsiella pneumoniae subsp. pneumoniae]
PVDPRKAAVEAAIARAKARKAEQQAAPVDAPAAEPVDPRKAAVEAARTVIPGVQRAGTLKQQPPPPP